MSTSKNGGKQPIKGKGKLKNERPYISRNLGMLQIILTPDNAIYTHIDGGHLVGGAERLLKKLGAKWNLEGDEIVFKAKDRAEVERVFKSSRMLTAFNQSVSL